MSVTLLVVASERRAPGDFGARVRAARGYLGISQAQLAQKLDASGASASTIKAWENGSNIPNALVVESLIPRLSELSGLPESFFWSADEPSAEPIEQRLGEVSQRLRALEEAFQDLTRELLVRDREESQRTAEGGRQAPATQPPRQP